jgi:TonB-dependent SusC/RagA subfamily outer membrane receptor
MTSMESARRDPTPGPRSLAAACLAAGLLAGTLAAGGCAGPRPGGTPTPLARGVARDTVDLGYGTSDRSALTTAVGTVRAEDMGGQPMLRVEELLLARVPGVLVTRRGNGEYQVSIRGLAGQFGTGEPLWVVDGTPVGSSRALAGLVPQDVARIDVLKDAASTAIYGAQGVNGVILVRTKRGP